MSLKSNVEAVLFYKTEPYSFSALAKFLEVPEEEVRAICIELQNERREGGICVVMTDTEVALTTAPEVSDLIEKLRKDELAQDIGKAGAETLSIILYRGPLTRIEVDRIRGVNSTFIIRNLLIRGLIEKRDNPKDSRSALYAGTSLLFTHLGITKREELPDFEAVMNAVDSFEQEDAKEAGEVIPTQES
jgi:segregation and condensation protein B